jgi:hypothetical protein
MSEPGRVLGINCLPANLAQIVGLSDIRGYDAFDPHRWLTLVNLASSTKRPDFEYAAIQWYATHYEFSPPNLVKLHPILDMLGLRYVIFRGSPRENLQPRFQSKDYWVMENPRALPRVFVPRQVVGMPQEEAILRHLDSPGFDARAVAYVETPVDLPPLIEGSAAIRQENPVQVVVDAEMTTPGLLVLADNWNAGWKAYVDGVAKPILQTNYAIRGVILPAGRQTVEFRYEPRGVAVGNRLALGSFMVLLAWVAIEWWLRRRARTTGGG